MQEVFLSAFRNRRSRKSGERRQRRDGGGHESHIAGTACTSPVGHEVAFRDLLLRHRHGVLRQLSLRGHAHGGAGNIGQDGSLEEDGPAGRLAGRQALTIQD